MLIIIRRVSLYDITETAIDTISKNIFYKEAGEKNYKISIDYLYSGKRHQGYLIYIEDDTQNQKYISFLNKFSDRLQAEVEKKTEHIVKMQDNLVLSMAMMVEGRDNSTGGHIKRTSDVVKILLDEIMNDTSDDVLKLSQRF